MISCDFIFWKGKLVQPTKHPPEMNSLSGVMANHFHSLDENEWEQHLDGLKGIIVNEGHGWQNGEQKTLGVDFLIDGCGDDDCHDITCSGSMVIPCDKPENHNKQL